MKTIPTLCTILMLALIFPGFCVFAGIVMVVCGADVETAAKVGNFGFNLYGVI